MIKVEDLKVLTNGGNVLVSNLSFSAAPGQIYVLSGESGSGNTVCARALCGLLPENLHVEGLLSCENAVYVGEDPDSQIVTLSVADEVASALEFSCVPTPEILSRSREALSLTGLSGLELQQPWTLSGGQRQRLALACAIARHPAALVLDEPCANIDPAGRELVYRTLREQANRGVTVILFEKRQELPSWADKLVFLPSPHEQSNFYNLSSSLWKSFSVQTIAPIVKVKNVFLGKKGARLVGANLELQPGKVHLLTGPNGCGKTSLMSVLAGATRPKSGMLEVDGKSVKRLPEGLLAWAQQNPERQFVQGTVEEEIAASLKNSQPDGPLSPEQLWDLPAAFDFAVPGKESPYSLSAGRKRRLSILLALLSNRPVVLLDEPTAGLGGMDGLNQVLHAYSRSGGTILVSSHDARLLLSDVMIEMSAGRIQAEPDATQCEIEAEPSPQTPSYPPLNPVTVVVALVLLVVLGMLIRDPMIVAALSLVYLVAALGYHRSLKRFALHVAIVVLAGAAFSLIALHSNWYRDIGIDWQAVLKHGSLGAILLSASLWAGSLTSVSQLADAASQRLRVPYTWCTLALTGTSIAAFLKNVAPLVATAVRLRRVRLGAAASNLLTCTLVPAYSALPLFIESIRQAQRLHITLTARDFGRNPIKTFRILYPWRARDIMTVFLLITLAALIAIL